MTIALAPTGCVATSTDSDNGGEDTAAEEEGLACNAGDLQRVYSIPASQRTTCIDLDTGHTRAVSSYTSCTGAEEMWLYIDASGNMSAGTTTQTRPFAILANRTFPSVTSCDIPSAKFIWSATGWPSSYVLLFRTSSANVYKVGGPGVQNGVASFSAARLSHLL